jgi:Protein of unknown function (DUF559)
VRFTLASPDLWMTQALRARIVGLDTQYPVMSQLPWPFLGSEALASQAIPECLMRNSYEPLYPGVFVPRGIKPSARQRATAAWLWSKRRSVVAGPSAAAMLGVKWVDGTQAAELNYHNRKTPKGIIVRAEDLAPGEVLSIGDMRVTNSARTAFDIGRHTPRRVEAVKRLDALANATGVTLTDIEEVVAAHPGARGLARLRRVLPFVDSGAESPQETVARLALIDAGIPAPSTQFEVFGRYGERIARVDMVYEEVKVGIEYDGPQHWEDPAVRQRDIDKQFELTALGWLIIRVSRDLLKYRRSTYVHRVETALRERGLEW